MLYISFPQSTDKYKISFIQLQIQENEYAVAKINKWLKISSFLERLKWEKCYSLSTSNSYSSLQPINPQKLHILLSLYMDWKPTYNVKTGRQVCLNSITGKVD